MASKLNLARFSSVSSNKQRLELVKDVDVTYSVPFDNQLELQPRNNYTGYTYLHFAAKKADVECTTELLSRGADLFKQGSHDGYTALHATIGESTDYMSRNIWESMGVLQENQVVNVLLSAHVKSGKTVNPISKKHEISHLHIACMFDHEEAVKFLATVEKSVHQATKSDARWLPGYTPLHFAVRYSSPKAAAVLLNHGADIFVKDVTGTSPLHLLNDRLMEVTDYLTMGREAIRLPYEKEIERIDAIITVIMKARKDNVNFVDESGLTGFHIACTLKDPSLVEYFLQQNVDVNSPVKDSSKLCPGWTPLHFAACCSIDTFKILLKSGANTNIYNTRGLTALNLFTRRHAPEVIHSALSSIKEFNEILFTDQSTKLSDFILSMKEHNKFKNFLKALPDVNITVPHDSPIWPGYSLLHLAVAMNERTKQWEHFREQSNYPANSDFREDLSRATKGIHLYGQRIQTLLQTNIIVDLANSDGMSPLQLAFKLYSAYHHLDELMRCTEKNLVGPGNLTHFHIACVLNDDYFVQEFFRQGADVNGRVERSFEWYGRKTNIRINTKPHLIPVTANSTPLHIAVIFGHINLAAYLLANGADVYAKDARGLTPIHLSMSPHRDSRGLAGLLLSRISNLRDSVTAEGLSHLHVAAFANSAASIEQLLKNGTNVNIRFDVPSAPTHFTDLEYNLDELLFTVYFAGTTPLHVATRQGATDAIRALIVEGEADIHAESSNKRRASPLNFALDWVGEGYFEYYYDRLKREGKDYIGPIEESMVTMLHVACAKFDLKWARLLLKSGADPNARVRDDADEWRGDTPLHVLAYHASFADNLPRNFAKLMRLLLENGADVTVLSDSGTPVHAAAEVGFLSLFFEASDEKLFMRDVADMLLMSQENFDVNPVDARGFSHLHYACVRNNVDIVEKFLDHGADVNQSNDPFAQVDPGFQPLHYAFAHGSFDVAKMLIERGADVGAQDRAGNMPLHVGVKNGFVDAEVINLLLSRGMDINAKNCDGVTPLQCLVQRNRFTLASLDHFISREAKIDVKSNKESIRLTRLAMKNALPAEREAVFRKLVSMFKIEAAISEGFDAIHSFVAVRGNMKFKKEFYLCVIQQFIVMGCDFDRRDVEGKTALHQAVQFCNNEALEALLLLGADVNLVDNDNEPLLTDETMTEYHDEELDEYDERKFNIIEKLADHAWKIQFVGLRVSDSMKEASQTVLEKFPLEPDEIQSFETELAKMAGVNVTNKITVRDFLAERGVVRDYPAMADLQRKTIDQFFNNFDYVTKEFPEFSAILFMQYRKAVARMKLHEPAMRGLTSLISIALPKFCLESILSDISNEDLKYFIEIAEDIHLLD